MRPATLLALAKRNRIDLPADTVEGLREWFRFRDFDQFVEVYVACSKALRNPEDFQLLLRDFAADQGRESIRYTEIHFTVGTHWLNGLAIDEILDAMEETIRAVEAEHGIVLRLIPDIVRDVGIRTADPTLEWAIEAHRRGIAVALGLTGREALFPSAPYAEHYAEARRRGLHGTAHAGEHGGAAVISSALDDCGAERIGHGVRSIDDPGLVERLRRDRVPVEVCPTSNVCLGIYPDVASHAFDRMRQAGLEVSVNTDDPALFDTTLSKELLNLHEAFGYSAEDLVDLTLAAVRHSFLAADDKARLEASYRDEIGGLAGEHLGRALDPL